MEVKKFKLRKQTSLVSWIVFLITLGVVLISLTSAVFPALVLISLGGFEHHLGIDPFETGIWAYPLLVTNFVLFGLGILYWKNMLPKPLTKSFRFIFNFEVSSHVAFLVITVLIGYYIFFSVGELIDGKYHVDYYERVKSYLERYTVTELGDWGLGKHLGLFLSTSSIQIFGNDKVISFIASIALVVLTYFTTVEITKKRFAGIVSMVILLQSGIFLIYDTSVAYPNFWILFYLLSLYLIYKKGSLSPIAYVSSLLSKSLTAAFFPMTVFFIYRAAITKQTKIRILIYYGVIVVLGIVLFSIAVVGLNLNEFSFHDFWGGFTAFQFSFRFDGLVLLFMLPLIVGLFIASRHGIVSADSIMFLIMGMLISAPFLAGFSDIVNVPYRFVPLIVFFAIGVGVLLSKRVNE